MFVRNVIQYVMVDVLLVDEIGDVRTNYRAEEQKRTYGLNNKTAVRALWCFLDW